MVEDRAILITYSGRPVESHMVYRTAPFSMTLNHPNQNFKVTPLFNAEYLGNDARYRHSYNDLRPSQECHF